MEGEVPAALQPNVQSMVDVGGGADVEPVAEAAGPSNARESGTPHLTLDVLKPGMRLKGRVRSVVEFGAFVDIGVGRDGLVHISALKRAGLDQAVKVGDEIEVLVRRVDPEEQRINLVVPLPKVAKTPLRELRVGSVVTGKVVRLADFGAFVDIGAQVDALLHVSQMAEGYVSHPSQVLEVGEEIQARIADVDLRKRRISLTMKDLTERNTAEESRDVKKAEDHIPTAFEVALEKARLESRRRRSKRL